MGTSTSTLSHEAKKLRERQLREYRTCLLSMEQTLKLEHRVLAEYPFLRSMSDSMVVTDFKAKDQPIIFANDAFEFLTLYPREEIIGRNCRFLQGKYTSKASVRKIRKALAKGRDLSITLLNYRKDGLPFWNSFLLLPVHKHGKKGGSVTHYIAIQKNVSLLYDIDQLKCIREWSPVEVAMWLDKTGFSVYSEKFCQKDVDGRTFLGLKKQDLVKLGMEDFVGNFAEADRERLAGLIEKMNERLSALPQSQIQHAIERSRARIPVSEYESMLEKDDSSGNYVIATRKVRSYSSGYSSSSDDDSSCYALTRTRSVEDSSSSPVVRRARVQGKPYPRTINESEEAFSMNRSKSSSDSIFDQGLQARANMLTNNRAHTKKEQRPRTNSADAGDPHAHRPLQFPSSDDSTSSDSSPPQSPKHNLTASNGEPMLNRSLMNDWALEARRFCEQTMSKKSNHCVCVAIKCYFTFEFETRPEEQKGLISPRNNSPRKERQSNSEKVKLDFSSPFVFLVSKEDLTLQNLRNELNKRFRGYPLEISVEYDPFGATLSDAIKLSATNLSPTSSAENIRLNNKSSGEVPQDSLQRQQVPRKALTNDFLLGEAVNLVHGGTLCLHLSTPSLVRDVSQKLEAQMGIP